MEAQRKLEAAMDDYLVKQAPIQVPAGGREAIVKYLPILALIGGILSFFAAFNLWQLGHTANDLINTANELARSVGVETTATQLGISYYFAVAVMILQGALMFLAYPGLKANSKKRGWDILLYSNLIGFAYSVLVAFTNYGGFSNIIGGLVGLVIGLYLLAQIKSYYTDGKVAAKVAAPTAAAVKPAVKAKKTK